MSGESGQGWDEEGRRRFFARLGEVIIRRRVEMGMKTYALAKAAGVSDPFLRRVEQGDAPGMGLEPLVRIATGLGTTLVGLLAEVESDDPVRTLGERIRSRMDDAGLSGDDLARATGIPIGVIDLVEGGAITALEPEELAAVAAALDVSPAWLAEGEAPPMSYASLQDIRYALRHRFGMQSTDLLDHLMRQMEYLISFDRARRGLAQLDEVG